MYDFSNVLSHIFPCNSLLCLVVLTLSGYSASYLQYCTVIARIKTKKMMKVAMKTKTSVCPCVEVMLSCLCTPLYFLFALNDQRRSMRDHVHYTPKTAETKTTQQVDNHRSNSVHMYVIYAVHVCILKV